MEFIGYGLETFLGVPDCWEFGNIGEWLVSYFMSTQRELGHIVIACTKGNLRSENIWVIWASVSRPTIPWDALMFSFSSACRTIDAITILGPWGFGFCTRKVIKSRQSMTFRTCGKDVCRSTHGYDTSDQLTLYEVETTYSPMFDIWCNVIGENPLSTLPGAS